MSRLTVFNSPLLLGFDHVERMLASISKNSGDGYPPYNIEQVGEDGLRISLAVAGFSEDNLTIEVEDRQLRIHGKQIDESSRMYLHRGIAARQFIRSFVLADGIEITDAELDNGLLHIDLMRPSVESRVQTIEINSDKKPSRKKTAVDVKVD